MQAHIMGRGQGKYATTATYIPGHNNTLQYPKVYINNRTCLQNTNKWVWNYVGKRGNKVHI